MVRHSALSLSRLISNFCCRNCGIASGWNTLAGLPSAECSRLSLNCLSARLGKLADLEQTISPTAF